MYILIHSKIFNNKLGITFIFPFRIKDHRTRTLSSVLMNQRILGNYTCTFTIIFHFFSDGFPFYFIFLGRLYHLMKFIDLIKFKP